MISMMFFYLHEASSMKDARVSEQASVEHAPLVNEIGNWVGILQPTHMHQMSNIVQTQLVNYDE